MFKNEYLNQEQMKPSQAEEDHHFEKAKGRDDGESMREIARPGLETDVTKFLVKEVSASKDVKTKGTNAPQLKGGIKK